ncbi:MAG: diaminopimelate epimerase [Myxococcota bacterium]
MLEFTKVEGLANDFILLDRREGGPTLHADQVRQLCHRRRGVGADGVLTLLPPERGADVRLLIQNADGSVPEMCGNGLRCVIRYLEHEGPMSKVRVETGAGFREGWSAPEGDITVTLGEGRVLSPQIPVQLGEASLFGVEVDMGNPHLVVFPTVAAAAGRSMTELADRYGPELELHPRFPERVNVGFATFADDGFELVVFERGAGRTEACGTGAGACALAAQYVGRWTAGPTVPVLLPGGPMKVGLPTPERREVLITGPAHIVFRGAWRAPSDERAAWIG